MEVEHIIREESKSEEYDSNEYMIKNLDNGEVYDIRNREDSVKLESHLYSICKKDDDGISFMLENLKIQEKINTKFFKACERGDLDKINTMLSRKISTDRKPNLNEKYLHNYTVLHVSTTNNHFDVLNLLLERGADLEAETTMKRRPIHLAVLHGNFQIVDHLIACGAEVNCVDIDNNTPLHYASRSGNKKIVEFLLYKRAKVGIKNIFGETALDVVCNAQIYNVFLTFLGSKKEVDKYRDKYTRTLFKNKIYHNNRCDNIRKILYKDNLIAQKYTELGTNIKPSQINQEIDFPTNTAVDLDSFKIIELLGKGSFGEVYLVELNETKKKYAMKVLNKNKLLSQNIIRYVVTERNVLSNIKHPFIVQLYYAFQTDDFLYLILEYCEGKDLCYHLRKNKYFDEETTKIILAQLLLAIEELHRSGIIYRDLKPENIVLDSDGFIKLTDFGLSKEGVNDNCSAKSFCGSLAYLAPEILSRMGHGKSVDWYLFGVLMYEMLMGIPPYYTTVSKEALFYNIKHGKLTFPKRISKEARNLIQKLLNRNPLKRLGSGILDANEIKSQAFFSGIDFNKVLIKQFIPPKLFLKHLISEQNKEISREVKFPKNLLTDFICNRELLEDMKSNKKSADTSIEGWTFIGNNKYKIKQS